MRYAISSGSPFEKIGGYSRAIVDGDWVFISGTAGYVAGEVDADDAVAQTVKSLAIISETMAEAGGTLKDIVSLRVYVARREDIIPIATHLGTVFDDPRPTNTTVTCGFVNDEIKVEIEVTARLQK
ncbi:enamine deaminase RidA (YjgF/YER057c/UK114 family) [Pacificibacter maritimus]|uniref:Enamine deaminase RidA (YjgF/YER057c/UK114 family) n=1 Tax=Pacificibacter maritimus TaxID=762213 RepID=A0A3N4U867_9RHOB|nr:RidA family protein [Pacificibacter maritimus]RPE66642.1 enamine deaminase RidA (YjgF/YER057c/UK114 family) [Pacificibacter maritimus]